MLDKIYKFVTSRGWYITWGIIAPLFAGLAVAMLVFLPELSRPSTVIWTVAVVVNLWATWDSWKSVMKHEPAQPDARIIEAADGTRGLAGMTVIAGAAMKLGQYDIIPFGDLYFIADNHRESKEMRVHGDLPSALSWVAERYGDKKEFDSIVSQFDEKE